MEFSEMKMIWDSQNQEPLYAMNEAALQEIVQRRESGIGALFIALLRDGDHRWCDLRRLDVPLRRGVGR